MNDFLLTTAEIAIALAGFSGVVVAFGRGVAGLPSFRLKLLLSLSGETVLFSLIPFVFGLKLTDAHTWFVVAITYGITHLVHIAYSIFGYQSERAGTSTPNLDKALMTIGALLGMSLIGTALIGSPSDTQTIYASLLVFVLCVAGTQFLRLLLLVQEGRSQ